ncbi:MAG TPA: glycoside hydrolase family 88 protein [Kofleriaceae bacterium]|nr:glycoside hydrolase family 88 protein [Kofleriaceae bacterium]
MSRLSLTCALTLVVGCGDNLGPLPAVRVGTPCPRTVVREVNDHWIAVHPDATDADTDWERATYFIGDMAAADALGEPGYLAYAQRWADGHRYKLSDSTYTRNADNHAAGQVYLQLYEREGDPAMLADIAASLDNIVRSDRRDDWSWIDAQFMASPSFAHLGELSGHARYTDTMFELFKDARDRRHLFDPAAGLWYRDENYLYPDNQTDNGAKIFWARGNGWVIASLVRTLAHLPAGSPYRAQYEDMLRAMAAALAKVQRDDGLWNVSLADPEDHPGPEASGSSFFTYAMAWGIRTGVLDRATYAPVVERGWRGLVSVAVRADGELGDVQGVGEQPSSSQPVTLRSTHEYGLGAFLLAGSEVETLGLELECSAPM